MMRFLIKIKVIIIAFFIFQHLYSGNHIIVINNTLFCKINIIKNIIKFIISLTQLSQTLCTLIFLSLTKTRAHDY